MSLHRATADKDSRYVQAHGCHQHAWGNLVAVGDADHGIGLVTVDHVLHRVGNDVARGQGVKHTVMAHGNAVVNGNGIELCGIAAKALYFAFHNLACLMEMGVARHKLGKRIDYGNNGLAKLFSLHAIGHPQGTSSCHTAAFSADTAA